jgi:hypothetical protein
MARDFSDFRISECDATIEKYGLTDFDSYLGQHFPRFNEAQRVAVLQQWDEMLSNETALTKEHAGHISRKRRLDDVHFLLKRSGR